MRPGKQQSSAALPPGKPKNWPHSTEEEVAALKTRNVMVGSAQRFSFVDNSVKTSKYEYWSFTPLFLLEEFSPYTKVANLYFLCIACLQMVKPISNTNGLPTFLIPLSIVVAIDAAFQALEDWARHRADHEANMTPATVFDCDTEEFIDIPRSTIKIGDIVRINNRGEIPADCIIISVHEKTSPAQGLCFVETKQLDGETNLKSRAALPNTFYTINSPKALNTLAGFVEMEHPNNLIDSFNGVIKLKKSEFFNDSGPGEYKAKQVIQSNNILLRGCVLRNTDYVYGLVVNTGHDTKIMMNSRGAKAKCSVLEANSSKEIGKIIMMLITICFFGAIGQTVWNSSNDVNTIWYLETDIKPASNFFIAIGYFFLLHASCIPVSLYVSMSIIRGGQMWFMNKDLDMYYAKNDTPAIVRTMNLNEELGQISHVFSDKTGTLTCNIMDFRKMSVGGISYGIGITEIGKASWKLQGKVIPQHVLDGEAKAKERSIPHVSFFCPDYDALMQDKSTNQYHEMNAFFRLLAMCHDVIPEHSDGKVKLSASNPDDEALVAAAAYFGFSFTDREEGYIVLDSREDGIQKIELLETIKFTSKRKRMSVVVKESDGSIRLLIKGADTAIIPRVAPGQDELLKETIKHMEQYSEEGLRCLLLGYRDLPAALWTKWAEKYNAASTDLAQLDLLKKGLSNKIEELEEEIESGLTLIGSTAIEDKLQDGVPECIAQLAEAGVNLWVLTGDKEETAINIAVACNLVLPVKYMDHIVINEKTAPTAVLMVDILQAQIERVKNETKGLPKALIIDGPSLIMALDTKSHYNCKQLLLELSKSCQAVVGCRVSPDQKREMVDLIKTGIPTVRTLAIGDGANDVAMIQEAHIGVGIKGEEGLQAVNSSDYAIAQFKYLSELMLKHGRYNYIRMSNLICFIFYKNVMGSISMFWFNIFCGWSGQKLYTEGAIQMFNLLFTSLPILFYGIYDRDIEIELIRKYPKMYADGVNNAYFNTKVFWSWILTALWQSIALCLIPFAFLVNAGSDGMSESFWASGALSYTAVIIVVNFKLFSFQNLWNWTAYGVIAFSIGLWMIFAYWVNLDMNLSFQTWYYVWNQILEDATFWAGLVFLVVVFSMYEVLFHGFSRAFYFSNTHILQESRHALEVHTPKEEDTTQTAPLLEEEESCESGMELISPA